MSAAVVDGIWLAESPRVGGARTRGADPRPAGAPAQQVRPAGAPARQVRPARGSGRESAPRLRPVGAVPAPDLRRDERSRAPRPAYVPMPSGSGVRLTDRGLALVAATAAIIIAAALTVIVLTAVRVTSDAYQPGSGELVTAGTAVGAGQLP